MKTRTAISILAVLTAGMTFVGAQDWPEEYLGLPGDNLNLYAVMDLFQESETLEGFERSLNDKNTMINNLDLNGDRLIDYITVSDYVDGDVHTIVLRAVLDRNDYQDVAVFIVELLRNGSVRIQLIGDEALYGKNYIVEPIYAETPNPGYTGKPAHRENINVVTTTYYDIAAWPLITYIYLPNYVVWRSSWYWGYYPVYWHPWNPYYWHYYYGYHYSWHHYYHKHYRHWNHYRYAGYHDFYHKRVRVYSPTVVVNINKGNYNRTYSRPDLRREGEALYTRVRATRSTPVETRTTRTVGRSTDATVTRSTTTTRDTRTAGRSSDATVTRSTTTTRSNATRTLGRSTPETRTTRTETRTATPTVNTRSESRTVERTATPAPRSTPETRTTRTESRPTTPTVNTRTEARTATPTVTNRNATRSSSPSTQSRTVRR